MNTATALETRPRIVLPAPIKYLLSAIILFTGFGGMIGLSLLKKAPPNRDKEESLTRVDTFAALTYEDNIGITVNGVVVPFKEVSLAAEVGGRIEVKTDKCQAGQIVFKDDLLIQIDKKDYELSLSQAKAELDQTKVSLKELEEEINGARKTKDLAEEELELQRKEHRLRMGLAKGVLSDTEMQQSERSLLTAKQAMERARNSLALMEQRRPRLESAVELAESRRDMAQLNLDRCEIRAPFDGIIVQDNCEAKEVIQQGAQIAVIEDMSKVEVQCNLRPDQIQWLWDNSSNPSNRESENPYELPPTQVEIASNFGDRIDASWKGELTSFDGIGLDERTKMLPCRVVVNEPVVTSESGRKRALLRGMFVKLEITIPVSAMSASGDDFVMFPAVAVQPGNYVWTLEDGIIQRYQVRLADKFTRNEEGLQYRKFVVLREFKPPTKGRTTATSLTSTNPKSDDENAIPPPQGITKGSKIILTPMSQPEVGNSVVEN